MGPVELGIGDDCPSRALQPLKTIKSASTQLQVFSVNQFSGMPLSLLFEKKQHRWAKTEGDRTAKAKEIALSFNDLR